MTHWHTSDSRNSISPNNDPSPAASVLLPENRHFNAAILSGPTKSELYQVNVMFLTSTLPRFSGDQQAPFVLEQAVAWKKKRPEDRLIILAPHDARAALSEDIDGVEILRFRYGWPEKFQTLAYPAILPNLRRNPLRAFQIRLFLWAQYRAGKRVLKSRQIDLVYAHWVMPQGIVAHRLNKITGVPYVLQNHSSDLAVFSKLGGVGRAIARKILRNARLLFCVNTQQREAARALLPDLECHVLPMGVALDVSHIATPMQASDCHYAIGSISRLSKKKGLDHLIAAAELLAEKGRRMRVGIAGDGEDAAALTKLPKVADVSFPGFLSGPEKHAFFNECFVMAFPSVSAQGDVEGLPVALLEAMAAGKLVIASADTNIALLEEWPEISSHVELLADPTDTDAFAKSIEAVLDLASDEVVARSQHLRRVIGRYRWDRLIDEYLSIVETAVVEN